MVQRKSNRIICFILTLAFSLSVLVGCAPAPQKIKVQFISESAIYKTIDAETGKEIELPAEPVSKNGQFLGWYLDNGIWSKPFVEDTLVNIGVLDETTLNVYAKFGPVDIISGKSAIEYARYNLAGEDALGRLVYPAHGDRYDIDVGVFYSVWNGGGSEHPELQQDIRDIQDMIENEQLDVLTNSKNIGQFHYWGEPLYGYYRSEDKWVLMRHMELLSQADVDFICIDNTNDRIYVNATLALLETLLELHNAGYQEVLPKVTFYTNTESAKQINRIKTNFYEYQNEKFAPLWYSPNGKPLIIGTTTNNIGSDVHQNTTISADLYDAESQNYFDVKESQWPNGPDDPNGIPWMHWSRYKGDNSPSGIGYMAVPVAQHGQTYDSNHGGIDVNASSKYRESSRGYNPKMDCKEDAASGTSFKESWNDAMYFAERGTLKGVLITGWNEWIAQKQDGGKFVDVYNNEFSRDMEMMVDDATSASVGYGDNFYMQLVQQVRDLKYKLHNGGRVVSLPEKTIDIYDTNYALTWTYANATYRDFKGDALARNCQNAANGGATQEVYVDNTNRNDIKTIRVAHDSQYLYMYVDCATTITPYQAGDTAWMNVLIGVEYGDDTSFGSYTYMVNRTPNVGNNTTTIHRYINKEWVQVGTAEYNLHGEVITFKIPLSDIGGSSSIRFKVSDNVQRDSRFNHNPIMNYYITGDSAPLGRLGYTYNF